MSTRVEDRRVRKTKKLLKDNFIELMNEKKVKDITVKDITDRADLNRGTFYLHYLDIYDLLGSIEDEVIKNVEDMLMHFNQSYDHQTTFQLLEQLFTYVYENKTIFQILLHNQSEGMFLSKIQNLIKTLGLETLKTVCNDTNTEYYSFFLSFASSGVLGVIGYWFETGLKQSPQEIAYLIDGIISQGVKSFRI